MRKTIATVILTGALAVSGAPVFADTPSGGGGTLPCSQVPSGEPCVPDRLPLCSTAPSGEPCAPDRCDATQVGTLLAARDRKIAAQQAKIKHKNAVIKRLRHRLASR